MKKADTTESYRGHLLIQSGIKLNFVDRVRLIFGSKLSVQVHVHTRWKVGEYKTEAGLQIEEVFSKWRFVLKRLFIGKPREVAE